MKLIKALGRVIRYSLTSGTKHYEIGGYLHSGSAIVYEGNRPAEYGRDEE